MALVPARLCTCDVVLVTLLCLCMCAGVWVAFCVSDLTVMKISKVISVHGFESFLLILAGFRTLFLIIRGIFVFSYCFLVVVIMLMTDSNIHYTNQ